jgi:hypothetical protein
MKKLISLIFICLAISSAYSQGTDHDRLIETAKYASGEVVPYILTEINLQKPKYGVILMPGGNGNLSPYMQDGKLIFQLPGNFLIRSRALFADSETLVVSTDSSGSAERVGAILDDLNKRYPNLEIYIIGTSRGTYSTMQLGQRIDGQVAGFIHTSSMSSISGYDTRNFKSRHLLVHHVNDGCHLTSYAGAKSNHEKFGTKLISVEGGDSYGDPCLSQAYHGFKNIETAVITQIKAWIKTSE